jgi:hypothetical protein
MRKTLFTHQAPYFAEVVGVGIVPRLGSVRGLQATLDGGVCDFEALSEVHDKAPCTKQCWEATEERCVCRCGGLNHGRAWRNNTSLEDFSEAGDEVPVVGRDIMRGKMELLWLARKEVVAAYTLALGGRR